MDADITEFENVNPQKKYGTPRRKELFDRWRRQRATTEYHRWKSRRFGSADAYKEDVGRNGGYYGSGDHGRFAAERARQNGKGEALSEKVEALRRKYELPEYRTLEGGPYWNAEIQYPDTYAGMFA